MKDELQFYIYSEKLLAHLYQQAASLALKQDEKDAMLKNAQESIQNANYLNYFYRYDYGTNFDPMIPETHIQGTYQQLLSEIQKQELSTYLQYRTLTYNQSNNELKETMNAITDNKLGHILVIMSLLITF
ncbi:MAG: hypothetical protein LUH02_02005 [Erysipelotrichaceae bacterium]|nr:hypothetical protein [Erysipelotrichaceae bacterium]